MNQPKQFWRELESARGIAALIVAGSHARGMSVLIDGQSKHLQDIFRESASASERLLGHVLILFTNGHAAVWFFFVLSGFVLAASLSQEGACNWKIVGNFVLKRIARIYPAVFFAIAIFVVVYAATGLSLASGVFYEPLSILRNLLLIDTSIDGVMWSTQLEVLATPLIFLSYWLWHKGHARTLFALAAILTLLSLFGWWRRLWPGPMSILSFSGQLYMFVVGVAAYAKGRSIVSAVPAQHHTACTLGSAAAFILIGLYASRLAQIGQVMAAATLIVFLAYGKCPAVGTLLNARPVRFLGRVSYSFYLLHALAWALLIPVVLRTGFLISAGVPAVLVAVAVFGAITALTLPLAAISHSFVELPGIRAGRMLMSAWPSMSTVSPAPRAHNKKGPPEFPRTASE